MEKLASVAHSDFAVVPDNVVSGAPFLLWVITWAGFGSCRVAVVRAAPAKRSVRAVNVVVVAKFI